MRTYMKPIGVYGTITLAVWLAGCAQFAQPDLPEITAYLPAKAATNRTADVSTPARLAAGDRTLTLDDCVRIALENNPLHKMANEQAKAAREAAGMAEAPFYPTVGVDGGLGRWQQRVYLPNGIAPPGATVPDTVGPLNDWNADVRGHWTLFDSGERRARLRAANANLGVAQADAARMFQDIALSVYRAWFRYGSDMEMCVVARESLARAEDHLRLAGARYAAGDVPEVDVLRAKVETANARVYLVRAENDIDISRGNLNTAMGLPVEGLLRLAKDTNNPVSPSEINLTNAFDQAVRNRPVLRAGLMRVAAARHKVDGAMSTFGPSVFADGSYGRRDNDFFPQDEEWSARIGFAWPIFTGFSSVRDLRRARAELSREEAALEKQIQDVRQDVWLYYTRVKETDELIQTAKVMVANALESLRSVRERYRAGAAPMTDLLDAETSLSRAQAILVQAEGDYRIAQATFRWAVGDLLPPESPPPNG